MPKSKELELRLQRTEQQLSVFQKVSRFMVRDLSLSDVLQGIVSLVVRFGAGHTQPSHCIGDLLRPHKAFLWISRCQAATRFGLAAAGLGDDIRDRVFDNI